MLWISYCICLELVILITKHDQEPANWLKLQMRNHEEHLKTDAMTISMFFFYLNGISFGLVHVHVTYIILFYLYVQLAIWQSPGWSACSSIHHGRTEWRASSAWPAWLSPQQHRQPWLRGDRPSTRDPWPRWPGLRRMPFCRSNDLIIANGGYWNARYWNISLVL